MAHPGMEFEPQRLNFDPCIEVPGQHIQYSFNVGLGENYSYKLYLLPSWGR